MVGCCRAEAAVALRVVHCSPRAELLAAEYPNNINAVCSIFKNINDLMVDYIVAVGVARGRIPADAFLPARVHIEHVFFLTLILSLSLGY